MAIFIAVISHGHENLIRKINCLEKLSDDFNIIIKSNIPGEDFSFLSCYRNVHHIDNNFNLGFGSNNNYIFNYCISNLNMKDDDLFYVVNPDVYIEKSELYKLESLMIVNKMKFAAINLFKDKDFCIYDNSVRKFPTIKQFIFSFVGLGNDSIIDKSAINKAQNVDWAAGYFLAFTAEHYKKLKGFNELYFMYCEDIDICYRSYMQGCKIIYYPEVKALHYAKHANRKLFSKHLYWHICSVLRFLLSKKKITKFSSTIKS
ncbi:glycosyltransferase family 2 protein [Photobacterium carnosum]|uniref:glycosyltransferase family 2 protein n=1 Tax=Photobacterium carnosum TaxID=2023717 RepID=UPI001E45BFFB|nr:glycosyltransferase family 2 protein [Photobacterium carnosum]